MDATNSINSAGAGHCPILKLCLIDLKRSEFEWFTSLAEAALAFANADSSSSVDRVEIRSSIGSLYSGDRCLASAEVIEVGRYKAIRGEAQFMPLVWQVAEAIALRLRLGAFQNWELMTVDEVKIELDQFNPDEPGYDFWASALRGAK